ncbi:putative cwfj domain-containing protein [Eutypa lata UCREL1]|uniref:Putative cwfj domain-containing protein n=1 Tax=Eutypa lata (strain UCR-EL1) TaxID=1287681 RepID=M7SZH3_EUTLA|nr:putative cwfj domain-containing protein [Eutypa lata UCREL1]
MAAKIIVLGSLNGNFESAFKKLATLHAKQNFSFAIITGNLFSVDQDKDALSRLLSGQINVPLTTYFTVGTIPLPEQVIELVEKDEDVCENLHFLGKRSVTKTSDGIRIVALGGVLDKTIVGGQSKEQHMPLHTADDAKILRGANSADILLTTIWPSGVWTGSNVPITPENQAAITSSEEIAGLAATLKPRYHFCTSPNEFFYEREPFFHPPSSPESDEKAVTRFISLAPFGNTVKQKALYAFNLQVGETASSIPAGSTVSPYLARSNPRKRAAPTDAPDTFASSDLRIPCHQLIIPLPHEPTIRLMAAAAEKTYVEMNRFKEALQAMVATQSKYKLGAVTWEISRQANIHLHWQFLPISIDLLKKGLVEAGLKVEAENRNYPPFEEIELGSGVDEPGDFFRVWLWSDDGDTGIRSKELVMRLDEGFRFDLQFGRKVMAKLLGLEGRVDWKNVVQPILEETEDVNKFNEIFKPWDFTAE